jgi:hypothetical protein
VVDLSSYPSFGYLQNKVRCFGPQPHLWLSSTRCKNDIRIVMQCKQEINMQ